MTGPTLQAIYGHHLRRRGLADGTIRTRISNVDILSAWLYPLGVGQATTAMIEAFLDERDLSARTRYCWISHLHLFYRWAIIEGHLEVDPTERIIRPRMPRLLPRPIQDEDLAMALGAAAQQPMISAWLHLASYAGLRCAEIAGLDCGDVQLGPRMIRVMGKGGKERIVPLHDQAGISVRLAGIPRHGPLFVRPTGGSWSPERLSHTGNEFLHSLGLPETMHCLRHWFGSKTYEASLDIRVTQELMGHASPTTTAIYTAFSQQRGREAIDALTLGRGHLRSA
jgi:site-specific recombinase XerC